MAQRRKFTDEQIVGVVKQLEAGRTDAGMAREVGVSTYAIYSWKATCFGEFFVLMRLRGEAALDRQKAVNIRSSLGIFEKLWPGETVAKYAGLVLEDFPAWAPQTGSNPALEIMRRALDAAERPERIHSG